MMIDLYYWPTPNGHKITVFLEEAGLEYNIHRVNIGTGEQFKPEFLAIAPNNRIPAIVVAVRQLVFLKAVPYCFISLIKRRNLSRLKCGRECRL
jgi:Glutathione S-transferase, N-terminal domain